MATSFVSKDKLHGFWVNDALMQIIYWGFIKVIEDPSFDCPTWMKEG